MAHGLSSVLKRGKTESKGGMGSRRIFAPHFKLQVLDSYRNDADCKGNQRATARKYGIHRRQIQKWLQVEASLRSSVGEGGAVEAGAQRSEARIPSPLDFTTRRSPPLPLDPAAPMDLSLKRPGHGAPATFRPPSPPRAPTPPGLQPHPDVWDLSTKRRHEDPSPRPVKLFKPYLDDDEPKKAPAPPCCSQGCFANATCDYYYNNNNVCDSSYTLHELQPKSTVSYYYTFPAAYPGPDFEVGPFGYDEAGYVPNMVPLKQRHSYSLDFKLSAIECYYQDSVCKGNQRAVATKYNVHRRQVQKWLKQADELRQKNETVKQAQTVR